MVDLDLEWGAMTSWSHVVHETMLPASLLFFFSMKSLDYPSQTALSQLTATRIVKIKNTIYVQ